MAFSARQRRPQYFDEHDRDWGRALNSRLSVLTLNEEGSAGSADLWVDTALGAARTLRPSDDGRSSCMGNPVYTDKFIRQGSPEEWTGKVPGKFDSSNSNIDATEEVASDCGRLRSGYECNSGDGVGSETARIPTLKALDDSELPDVADGYWRQALTRAAEAAIPRLRDGDGIFDKSAALEANTDKALEVTYELMHAKDPKDIDESLSFSRVANVRLGAARTILNTQVKVDEVRLKRKSADLLPAILKRLAEEEARLTIEG